MEKYPLLLTATIKPQTHYELNLKDSNIRYKQYLENLIRCITQSDFTHFVFCENSFTPFSDRQEIEKLCTFYGKKIEFLSFQGDFDKIQKLTRAYGDQEIIDYAFDNSQFIQDAGGFYKLTGRYWIKNINHILYFWQFPKTVFIRGGLGKNTVHTAFFKVSNDYFKIHFYQKGDQLNIFENSSLERLYYYYIKQSGINMTISGVHPEFSAEWGAGGRMDEHGWRRWKTKLFAKLGVYDIRTTKFQQGDSILKQ